jgi:hypothetical protein
MGAERTEVAIRHGPDKGLMKAVSVSDETAPGPRTVLRQRAVRIQNVDCRRCSSSQPLARDSRRTLVGGDGERTLDRRLLTAREPRKRIVGVLQGRQHGLLVVGERLVAATSGAAS